MIKYGSIYIIRNTINNKVYIGQTKANIKLRFQNHLSAARRGKDYVIGKAIRKYGEQNFYISLIEKCNINNLNDREKYWISYYKSTNNKYGYNISIGGNVVKAIKELNKEEVLNLFNLGISAYKIAKILHTEIAKVTKLLKSLNIKYGLDLQKTNSEDTNNIIYLYLKDYSTVEISKKFNLNKSTIRRILLRNNIKLRTLKRLKIWEEISQH